METTSPAPSSLSIKSDHSMDRPITFGNRHHREIETASPAPSSVSIKSDHSMDRPITFGNRDRKSCIQIHLRSMETTSPAPSSLSIKSDHSMDRPITFGNRDYREIETASPAPSSVSIKSDHSMDRPITFGNRHHSDLTTSLLMEEDFRCYLCTKLLKDPVSIPCGHNYCKLCIDSHWNKLKETDDCACPQCRKRFRHLPVLSTNSALEKVIRKLQEGKFKVPAPPKRSYAGPGDVACDICAEDKLKAVKSCLTCTVSYCETHVRQHYTVPGLQRHSLVEVTGDLKERLCLEHQRPLEVFCKTDQMSVCLVCALQEHKSHDTVKIERNEQVNTRELTSLSRLMLTPTRHRTLNDLQKIVEEVTNELSYFKDCVGVAALSRPMELGMLYDCRNDSFYSDGFLWRESTISSKQLSLPLVQREVKCIEGDSLQDRFDALDVSTPLKASFLIGLVEFSGTSGYLSHPQKSKLQDRITLIYGSTTRLDVLSQRIFDEEALSNKKKGTHVVVAILYGAQAVFVFDSPHHEKQDVSDRDSDIRNVIRNLSSMSQSKHLNLASTDLEKIDKSLIECVVYSDVDTPKTMDLDTALEVYNSLPTRLEQKNNKLVPLRVWLYPLKNLDPAGACIALEICDNMLIKAANVLQQLREVIGRGQAIMRDHCCVLKWFPPAEVSLIQFIHLLQNQQTKLQKALARDLIQESGESGEQRIRDILKSCEESLFNPLHLNEWLNCKETEFDAITVCKTTGISFCRTREELELAIKASQINMVLCLTSLGEEDPNISTMQKSIHIDFMIQSWCTGLKEEHNVRLQHLKHKIQSDVNLFTVVQEDKTVGEDVKFIAAVLANNSSPGCSILLYQKGKLLCTDFRLGSKAEPFRILQVNSDSVTLQFSETQKLGQISSYRILYKEINNAITVNPWNATVILGPSSNVVVPMLKPSTQYHLKYSTIGLTGMSDFSEVVSLKTKRSAPTQPSVSRQANGTTETVEVHWLPPGNVASVHHYNVEIKEAGLEGWSTIQTKGPELYCLITLPFSTCYRVRVSAVYEDGDVSEPSMETEVPVKVWTIDLSKRKASILLEVLKLQAEKKPVELWGWSDEESEVRSFLQCLPYISQLRFKLKDQKRSDEDRNKKARTFFLNLGLQAVLLEKRSIKKTTTQIVSLSDHYNKCDFLLDLYTHTKDYETRTGKVVLPRLLSVYLSAAPAVWSIDLSKRKASIFLEVLKLQAEKKPVELMGWSDEESEVRSFLQCLPYISELSVNEDFRTEDLGKLFWQAAEWDEQTGEKTLEMLWSLCSYGDCPLWDEHDFMSDFVLDLFSHVKDYETQTGRSVIPALQRIVHSEGPAVWSIDLSKRKASIFLEVLKIQPEKKPLKLKGWSDDESEVRSFFQCLPYISELSVGKAEDLVKLFCQAAKWEEQTGEKTLELLSSLYFHDNSTVGDDFMSDFVLDLFSHVKDYETQTGRSVLPALQSIFQYAAPGVWSIDLSKRKASIFLEVLKFQAKKKPLKLMGWSDEESEVKSFFQCLPYISHHGMDFTLKGKLSRKSCRSMGRVLARCGSRVDLTLSPCNSLKGISLLFKHVKKLQKLRLNEFLSVKLSRLARTGRGAPSLAIDELSLVLKSTRHQSARLTSTVMSSVMSLLRLWSVSRLDLTEFYTQTSSLITLLGHNGLLSIRVLPESFEQLAVVVFEAQDKDLTQSFLEKFGGDLTSCSLDWEVLLYLLQQSNQDIIVDFRRNRLSERNILDVIPFLSRVIFKRPSTRFMVSAIRGIHKRGSRDCVSGLLRSVGHVINLNTRKLDAVDCAALCFTLQHSKKLRLNLVWTSIPPGEIENILSLLDQVSQLCVDRRLLLRFLHCAASQGHQGAASKLLRALQHTLDFSSFSVDLSDEKKSVSLCLSVGDCRAISTILGLSPHRETQLILRECEVEAGGLDLLFPVMNKFQLKPSKAQLLHLLSLVPVGTERGTVSRAKALCGALGGELDLSETPLDQRACGSLALVLEHSEELSELDLSRCQITNQFLELLLPHLHKAQVLDLSYNKITDALTVRILQLTSINSSIHTVRLFNNSIIDKTPFRKEKRFEIC